MKKALILHSWHSTSEGNWYRWLKGELEKLGYKVWLPDIPTMNTNTPNLETMLAFILESNFVDSDTIIVGHSLGSVLSLRLAEKVTYKTDVILSGWDFNDLTLEHASFWQKPLNYQKIKENVSQITTLISDNDFYISKYQSLTMAKRLGAQIVEVGNRGHFLTKKDGVETIPEILKFV